MSSIFVSGYLGLPSLKIEGEPGNGHYSYLRNVFGDNNFSPDPDSQYESGTSKYLKASELMISDSDGSPRRFNSVKPYRRLKDVHKFYGSSFERGVGSNSGPFGAIYGYLQNYNYAFGVADNTAYNKCLSRFHDEIRGADFAGLTAMLEAPEIVDLYKQLRSIINGLKSRPMQKALRHLKNVGPLVAVSEQYLLYTFAIAPLIQSITDFIDHLQNGGGFQDTPSSTASASFDLFTRDRRLVGDWAVGYNTNCTGSVRYKMGCTVSLTDLRSFLRSGSGLADFSSFWEVVPLSFVVDWFFNIGSYLHTLQYSLKQPGVELSNVYVSRTTRIFSEADQHEYNALLGIRRDGVQRRRVSTLDRTIHNGSLPYPRLPSFTMPGIPGQYLSLAALVAIFNPK